MKRISGFDPLERRAFQHVAVRPHLRSSVSTQKYLSYPPLINTAIRPVVRHIVRRPKRIVTKIVRIPDSSYSLYDDLSSSWDSSTEYSTDDFSVSLSSSESSDDNIVRIRERSRRCRRRQKKGGTVCCRRCCKCCQLSDDEFM
jgi:hypothetical protein